MRYPEDSIQSQYAASPKIRALIGGLNLRIDPGVDIDLFYEKIFNIYTAAGVGLDNWGEILGIGRLLKVTVSDVFGFNGSNLQPFDQGTFYYAGATDNYRLADEPYRELLLLKALANISAANAATLNLLLQRLFGTQSAYVIEAGTMYLRFIFEFTPAPWQWSIFQTIGTLTTGAGVGYEYFALDPATTFGFAGSGLQPFDQGVFIQSGPTRPTNPKV